MVSRLVAAEALVASEELLLLCRSAPGQGTQLHGLRSQVDRWRCSLVDKVGSVEGGPGG